MTSAGRLTFAVGVVIIVAGSATGYPALLSMGA